MPKLTESKDTVIKKNQSWFNDASVQIVRVIFKSSIRHLQEADSSTGIAANIANSAFYMGILCVEPHTMAPSTSFCALCRKTSGWLPTFFLTHRRTCTDQCRPCQQLQCCPGWPACLAGRSRFVHSMDTPEDMLKLIPSFASSCDTVSDSCMSCRKDQCLLILPCLRP